MVFGCLKSPPRHSWTASSFPGGKSSSPSMLFGPVYTGSPYMATTAALPAMAIPASSPMFVPMQMSAPVQTIPVPVAVQQPSPVIQVHPTHVIQINPPPHLYSLPGSTTPIPPTSTTPIPTTSTTPIPTSSTTPIPTTSTPTTSA